MTETIVGGKVQRIQAMLYAKPAFDIEQMFDPLAL
jgi:hypothetical protein